MESSKGKIMKAPIRIIKKKFMKDVLKSES